MIVYIIMVTSLNTQPIVLLSMLIRYSLNTLDVMLKDYFLIVFDSGQNIADICGPKNPRKQTF